MPYPESLQHKYINYRVDRGTDYNDELAGQLVHGLLPNKTSNAMTTVISDQPVDRRMGPIRGVQKLYGPRDQPWNFTFLKYYGGAVTFAPLSGSVMTGPMTGCYVFQYTQGGTQYLAHVGTADMSNSPATLAVKNTWRQFIARPDVSMVSGMEPASQFTEGELRTAMFGEVAPITVAYVSGGRAYALLLVEVPSQFNPPGMQLTLVDKVKSVPMQPWAAIDAKF